MNAFFSNEIVQISFLSWAIAQITKILIDIFREGKFKPSLIISSGGMPSSHSACVTSMAMGVGFINGFDSSIFGFAFVVAMIVMYDAAGVRRAAGKQAEVLNIIIRSSKGINADATLKELLGHTPLQVLAGAALGISIACVKFL